MNQIFVYCGEDIVSSRKAFLDHLESFEKDNYEVLRLAGKDLSEETLENVSSPTSLFNEKRVLAIESLFSRPKSNEKDKIIKKLVSLSFPVVLWEGKDFAKTDQLKYSGFSFKNYKLPTSMFHFLESFGPGKVETNLMSLKKALWVTDPNFLFLMLVRQIRLLLLIKDKKVEPKIAPWQKTKLEKQAAGFSLDQLGEIYRQLLEIDYLQKTSGTPFSLEHQLELLVMEI